MISGNGSLLELERRRGGLLITALLLCSIISLITLPSYIMLSKTALRQSQRAMFNVAVVDLAETGLEHAVWAQNNVSSNPSGWTGWSTAQGSYYRNFTGFNFSGGVSGSVKVVVMAPNTADSVAIARASITLQDGQKIEKWVRSTLFRSQATMQGLALSGSLSMNGGGTLVDSWRSDHSVPYTDQNRQSNAKVATTSQATGSVSGSGTFNGSVSVGAASNGVNLPDWSMPKSVTNSYTAQAPAPVSMPAGGTSLTWSEQQNGTIGVAGQSSMYQMSTLALGNGGNMTIAGNVVLLLTSSEAALTINGGSVISLAAGATLSIYTPGNISLNGSGFINNAAAKNLKIFGTAVSPATQTFQWTGSTSISGLVYAPNANISMTGGGSHFYGAMTARSVSIDNGGLHFDESLYGFGAASSSTVSVRSYAELETPASQASYVSLMNL